MSKLTTAEWRQLKELEARVEVALEAANDAPEPLRDLLIDSLARLQALASRNEARTDAIDSIERALAALQAWHRWQPSSQPSA